MCEVAAPTGTAAAERWPLVDARLAKVASASRGDFKRRTGFLGNRQGEGTFAFWQRGRKRPGFADFKLIRCSQYGQAIGTAENPVKNGGAGEWHAASPQRVVHVYREWFFDLRFRAGIGPADEIHAPARKQREVYNAREAQGEVRLRLSAAAHSPLTSWWQRANRSRASLVDPAKKRAVRRDVGAVPAASLMRTKNWPMRPAANYTKRPVSLLRNSNRCTRPAIPAAIRGWTVSVVFLARVAESEVKPIAADDAAAVGWFPLDRLPKLAFDHAPLLERRKSGSPIARRDGHLLAGALAIKAGPPIEYTHTSNADIPPTNPQMKVLPGSVRGFPLEKPLHQAPDRDRNSARPAAAVGSS